jgi:hypothetical protein
MLSITPGQPWLKMLASSLESCQNPLLSSLASIPALTPIFCKDFIRFLTPYTGSSGCFAGHIVLFYFIYLFSLIGE